MYLQQLESLCWHRNGEEFMSAHADGSYIVWSASDSTAPKDLALTPYGQYSEISEMTKFYLWIVSVTLQLCEMAFSI